MLKNRPLQEQVLILLAITIAAILAPFGIYRLLNADWMIGIFDITAMLLLLTLAANVYAKQHIEFAKKLLSIFVFIAVLITVYLKGKPQSVWLYPAIPLIFYLTTPYVAARVTLLSIAVMAYLMYPHMSLLELMTMVFTFIGTGVCSFAFGYQWHQHQKELMSLTITDPLTQVKNRRAFDHFIESLSQQSKTNGDCVLMIFDIDHFKQINDIHGHDVGDDVLKNIAAITKKILPEQSELYRIGGEEFLIVLHENTPQKATHFAQQLLTEISSAQLLPQQAVTVSIGLASLQDAQYSPKLWFKHADDALYRAKKNGRNNINIAASDQ